MFFKNSAVLVNIRSKTHLLLHLCECLSTWLYVHHMHAGAQRVQKMVLRPLDLEFQIAVSHHGGGRNRTCDLGKSSKCS